MEDASDKPEPKPEAKPVDKKPDVPAATVDAVTAKVDDTFRARADTMTMPPIQVPIGAPPALPVHEIQAPADVPTMIAPLGAVEDPTRMPGPRDVPSGSPDDLAPPPGAVPPGDSRSLRKRGEFALVYRQGNAVISRFGAVGTRGQWRVVEYPTTASASHAYAKECSRFVSEGFSDYRD